MHSARLVFVLGFCLLAASVASAPPTNSCPASRQDVYLRAHELLDQGRYQEAYDLFAKVAKDTDQERIDVTVVDSKLNMGWIHMRLGQLEEAERHLHAALEWADIAQQQARHAVEVWHLCTEERIICHNIICILMDQGRMGGAREMLHRIDRATEQRIVMENQMWALIKELDLQDPYGDGMTELNRAHLLYVAGYFEEARETFREVEGEAEKKSMRHMRYIQMQALRLLVEDAAMFERDDEALAYVRKGMAVPLYPAFAFAWHEMAGLHACLQQARGDDPDEALQAIDRAVEELEKAQDATRALSLRIRKCYLLQNIGRSDEAVSLIDSVIQAARAKKYVRIEGNALVARAHVKECDGSDVSIGAGLIKALLIKRKLGLKVGEPAIYLLYGHWLCNAAHHDMAVQTLEQGLALCRSLRMPHFAARMLLVLAETYAQTGNRDMFRETWKRIDLHLAEHAGLPKPTMELVEEQRKAIAEVRQTESEFAGEGPTEPPSAAALLDLQPRHASTRVNVDEMARTRFLLLNPYARETSALLEIMGEDLNCEWEQIEQGWLVRLSSDHSATNCSNRITVAPGRSTLVFLEADPNTNQSAQTVSLHCDAADCGVTWDFGFTNDTRSVAVVNASLIEENPFFAIPFYHEVYYRGHARALRNVKVETSSPCRVELLEEASNRILAIDADGDGDFKDPGDDVYQDADHSGYPDLPFGPDRDVAVLRLLVFPVGHEVVNGEININILIEEDGQWNLQAVDTLELLRGGQGTGK